MHALLLSLLILAGPAPAAAPVPASAAARAVDLAALRAEYADALARWERAGADRRTHPAIELLPRFEAAGETEPEALLWVLDHLREARLSASRRRAKAGEIFSRLLAPEVGAGLRVDALLKLGELARSVDADEAPGWLAPLADDPDAEVRAAVLYARAELVGDGGRSRDEERLAEAAALLDRLLAEHAGTRGARAAGAARFSLLRNEIARAQQDYYRELRAEGRELDEAALGGDPARAAWKQVEALAQAGVADALLYQVQHAQYSGAEDVDALRSRIVARLVEEHAGDAAAIGLARELPNLHKQGALDGAALAEKLLERSPSRDVRAEALVALVQLRFETARTDEELAAAHALVARLRAEFVGHAAIGRAEELVAAAQLAPGKPAPDFRATDVDGVELALSDYRGKVVLLDFWGFW